MLIEGVVERIIEDVVAVVDGDWEMMAAIFVLELDAVRGVVGIRDFTVYVCDGDGYQGRPLFFLGFSSTGAGSGFCTSCTAAPCGALALAISCERRARQLSEYLSFWWRNKSRFVHKHCMGRWSKLPR